MIFKNANESIWDHYKYDSLLGVGKKTEKPIKLKKNNWKNRTVKKNQLKFWKNRPVWFQFYKPETEKNRGKPKKPSQTEPSRFEPVLSKKIKPNRNQSVWTGFGFFSKKKIDLVTFFDKNWTEPKMITSIPYGSL